VASVTFTQSGYFSIARGSGGMPQRSAEPAPPGHFCNNLSALLFQLGVLGFGLLQDRDVRIGVFPEVEKIIVGSIGFDSIALQGVGMA
jgi:hypothetical protein